MMSERSRAIVTAAPPAPLRCRRCGGFVAPEARRCPHCEGPGPGVAWVRRSRQIMRIALGVVVGAIALVLALPVVIGWLGGDGDGVAYVAGMLIGVPAVLLLVPVAFVAAAVDLGGHRAYPAKPIAASWDVTADGDVHVVSLPASRISAPDHAWVDGARTALEWMPRGSTPALALLDGGTFTGILRVEVDASDAAVQIGVGILSAILGAGVGGGPALRYALTVEGGSVEAVPIRGGERLS
jgi:hypothetical protein